MAPHFIVRLCPVSSRYHVFALLVFLYWFAITQLSGKEIPGYDHSENLSSKMDAALHLLAETNIFIKKYMTFTRTMNPHKPMDCQEVIQTGFNLSGIYTIWPKSRLTKGQALDVFCDMDTDGGGWTVLQRRGDFKRPKDYFNQHWKSYKKGFGDLDKEFWIGNDNIFALTNQRAYSVRFDLESMEGEKRFALYDYFWIDDENHKYTLHIKGYSGDAGDSMTKTHNNMKFSTEDQDNDVGDGNCGSMYDAGWWFNSCYNALLNGINERGPVAENGNAIKWIAFTGRNQSLHSTEIKIRPKKSLKEF